MLSYLFNYFVKDYASLSYIAIFFIISCLLGFSMISFFRLRKKYIALCVLSSAILHFIGSIFYWYFADISSSDVYGYFAGSSYRIYNFTGGNFIATITYILRKFIFGNSYLGTYSFFAMLGFLGSVMYLIIFHRMLNTLEREYGFDYKPKSVQVFSFIISCWPSAMFWASSLGKDSVCYFMIALFFLGLSTIRESKTLSILAIIFSFSIMSLIRPYLFLIVVVAFFSWLIFYSQRQIHWFAKLFLVLIVSFSFAFLSKYIADVGGLNDYSLKEIAMRGIRQQQILAEGTYIKVPTHNPILFFLFLPYTMLANLFLPLFFFVRSVFQFLASIENMFLLLMIYYFFMKRRYWKIIARSNPLLSYMFCFFIAGIGFLGLTNTNLGLATRMKTMYVSAFLLVIFLTFVIKKIVSRDRFIQKNIALNS